MLSNYFRFWEVIEAEVKSKKMMTKIKKSFVMVISSALEGTTVPVPVYINNR